MTLRRNGVHSTFAVDTAFVGMCCLQKTRLEWPNNDQPALFAVSSSRFCATCDRRLTRFFTTLYQNGAPRLRNAVITNIPKISFCFHRYHGLGTSNSVKLKSESLLLTCL